MDIKQIIIDLKRTINDLNSQKDHLTNLEKERNLDLSTKITELKNTITRKQEALSKLLGHFTIIVD